MQNDESSNDEASTNTPETNWKFQSEDNAGTQTGSENKSSVADVKWTASEFIEHAKSASWYGLLGVGTVLLAGLVYLVTSGDIISVVVVFIVAVIFGAFAARKPRELEYSVDNKGIKIGDKIYPYAEFRSFSIMQEEGIESIWFMPLKRFMPMLSIYFAPEDGQKIVEVLTDHLPLENRKLDAVDRLMHKLRF